jgi:hypothetical protein
MSDRYVWNGKPVSELTGDELREWLPNPQQLFTHSVEVDGMSLSIAYPEIDDAPGTKGPARAKKKPGSCRATESSTRRVTGHVGNRVSVLEIAGRKSGQRRLP